VHGAAIATLPQVSDQAISAAFAKLAAANANRSIAPPAELGDLPVVEVPAKPDAAPSDAFAIMMSGDGGWPGSIKHRRCLDAKGIAVVGLDSLRYY